MIQKQQNVQKDRIETLGKNQEGQQRKMLKNKICSIILAIILALPVCATQDVNTTEEEQTPAVNMIDEDIQNQSAETIPDNTLETIGTTSFKQPISKRKIAKKFLLAMGGVAASSLIIYFGLTLYNRFRYGEPIQTSILSSDNDSPLKTPGSLNEAIKTFVEKTKWE